MRVIGIVSTLRPGSTVYPGVAIHDVHWGHAMIPFENGDRLNGRSSKCASHHEE